MTLVCSYNNIERKNSRKKHNNSNKNWNLYISADNAYLEKNSRKFQNIGETFKNSQFVQKNLNSSLAFRNLSNGQTSVTITFNDKIRENHNPKDK